MPASLCTLRCCPGQTITTLRSLASRAWRGRFAPPSRSILAPPARCRRPRARWAAESQAGPENDMTTFTVHEPPPRKNEETASPVRFAFVRDGFYFWAFLLGPVWMLYHRLWLVLLMYLVGTTAIQAALWAIGVSGLVKFTVALLIAVLVGFEAGSLRRWSLRRWTNRG